MFYIPRKFVKIQISKLPTLLGLSSWILFFTFFCLSQTRFQATQNIFSTSQRISSRAGVFSELRFIKQKDQHNFVDFWSCENSRNQV